MHRLLTKNKTTTSFVLSLVAAAGIATIFAFNNPALAQEAPAPPPAGSTLDQRVQQRVAEQGIALEDKDAKRITSTCTKVQTKVRVLQQATTPAIEKRAKVDQKVDAKLWIMVGKLKIAGVDTFDLEKQRATLAGMVIAQQDIAKNYAQTLDDLAVINCQADPTAFKSLLETARAYRTELRDSITETKAFINDDIKNSIANYADDLKAKPSTETEEAAPAPKQNSSNNSSDEESSDEDSTESEE